MSLSQKHSGKILAPWYNIDEWFFVCDCINKNDGESLERALYVLRIWKSRMPLLSAGVEGTLILLEALFTSRQNPEGNRTHIYALSLLRFVNLCPANNERQGTVNKTAHQNDLPRWLIDIRHDIAHNHKLPSEAILELALWECLTWVRGKYWNRQLDVLKDCIVDEGVQSKRLEELLNVYIRLNISHISQGGIHEFDQAFTEKIKYFVKRYNKSETDMRGVMDVLEEMLKQSFAQTYDKVLMEIVPNMLVQRSGILYSNGSTEEGEEMLPTDIIRVWLNLLNLISENDILLPLLFKLFETTTGEERADCDKKIAAYWIKAIFQGLLRLKTKDKPEGSYVEFWDAEFLANFNTDLLQEVIINSPNKYTLIYLESLLTFIEKPKQFISDMVHLIQCITSIKQGPRYASNHIYTIFELDEPVRNNLKQELPSDCEVMDVTEDSSPNKHQWIKIKDTSKYIGCPLGVLPHQVRDKNPSIHIV